MSVFPIYEDEPAETVEDAIMEKLRHLEREMDHVSTEADALAWVSELAFDADYRHDNERNDRVALLPVVLLRLLAVRCRHIHELTLDLVPGKSNYPGGTFEDWFALHGEKIAPRKCHVKRSTFNDEFGEEVAPGNRG